MRYRVLGWLGGVPAVLLAAAAAGQGGGPVTVDIALKVAQLDGRERCVLEARLGNPTRTRFPGVTLEPVPGLRQRATLEFESSDGPGPWVARLPLTDSGDCAGAPRVEGIRVTRCGDEPVSTCAGLLTASVAGRRVTPQVAAGPAAAAAEGAAEIAIQQWRRLLVVAFASVPPERNFRVCEEVIVVANGSDLAIQLLVIERAGDRDAAPRRVTLAEPLNPNTAVVLDRRVLAQDDCDAAPPARGVAVLRCVLADGSACVGTVAAAGRSAE